MKTVLLLHGWNYNNYTKNTKSDDAWHNRQNFVDALSKKYNVIKINFPGFCGQKEPKRIWELDDFADYINNFIEKNKIDLDCIIGYSFGAAVAIRYINKYDKNTKIILVSPAIVRNQSKSRKFFKTPKFLNPIRNIVRNIYLKYIIKNPYIIFGTKFLNGTYQKIVRVNLINEVNSIDSNNVVLIYGNDDKMVNPDFVYKNLNKELKNKIYFIKRGSHDIANSHTVELVNIINKNL